MTGHFVTMLLTTIIFVIANCIPVSDPLINQDFHEFVSDVEFTETDYKTELENAIRELLKNQMKKTLNDVEYFEHSVRKNPSISNDKNTQDLETEIDDEPKNITPSLSEDKETGDDESDGETRNIPSEEEFRLYDKLLFQLTYKRFGKCHRFPFFSSKPFYMVSKCPESSTDLESIVLCQHSPVHVNEANKCIIDLQHIPVLDSRGIVYKNVYCSRCHGEQNVSLWTADLTFNKIPVLKLIDGLNSVDFLKNMDKMANCKKRIFPYNQNVIKHCEIPESEFTEHRHNFRTRNSPINELSSEPMSKIPLSFQILINFGINGEGHIIFSTEHPVDYVSCPENQVYYKGMCRDVSCDEGYHLENHVCQPDPNFSSEDSLFVLQNAEEMLFLTFRLNVSRADVLILKQPGSKQMIVELIAKSINVSSGRIKHFEMTIHNGTTTSKKIEIHHASTLKPKKRHNNSLTEDNEDEIKILSSFISEETGPENVSLSMEPPKPYDYLTDQSFDDVKRFTVELNFALLAGKKKSGSYKGFQNVVDSMNNLISSQSFNLVLNGTDLHISDIQQRNTTSKFNLMTWCVPGTKIMKNGTEVDIINATDPRTGRIVSGVYVNETRKFYGPDMYDFYLHVSGNFGDINNVTLSSIVFLCDTPRIQDGECAKLTLSSAEFKKLPEMNSILFQGEVFNSDKYEYVENSTDKVRICIYNQNGTSDTLVTSCGKTFQKVVVAESYLSFILGIISIAVTFLVLVTYVIFENLRNLPGVSTMNLTLALFLGELLFILSGISKPDWMCPIIGMLLHYLFLASFFWMNVMSYDVFKTFANKCILSRVRDKKKFLLRYALYAWGSPALIVAVCVIIDKTEIIPNVRIGYGGGSAKRQGVLEHHTSSDDNGSVITSSIHSPDQNLGCWIQEPVASLVAFGSPMLLILLSNSIMFVRTIICIRKTVKMVNIRTRRSSLSHVTGKSDVMLYVRMSTMMGFTWVFGLASSIVSASATSPTFAICIVLHVLGLLFIIFNCSQGLFIFFAFIFNRRVGKYYKMLFNKLKGKVAKSETLSSSRRTITSITSWSYIYDISSKTENILK